MARRLLPELLEERNYVVDSIRHPAEVEVLREVGERFRLIWVDADEATRLNRIRDRGRSGDPESIAELRSLEGQELESGDPAGQQLLAVRSLADEIVDNSGSIEQLHQAIHAILKKSLYFERLECSGKRDAPKGLSPEEVAPPRRSPVHANGDQAGMPSGIQTPVSWGSEAPFEPRSTG